MERDRGEERKSGRGIEGKMGRGEEGCDYGARC